MALTQDAGISNAGNSPKYVMINTERIQNCLAQIYGSRLDPHVIERLTTIIGTYRDRASPPRSVLLSERDAILIAYPDQIHESERLPLASLAEFSAKSLEGLVSGIHLLPFYPSSSDEGFSVIDYRTVAGEYGSWDDVKRLGRKFRLMYDAVINHASAESDWFRKFLQGEPRYSDYFIRIKDDPDLSAVVRPRAQPLLTRFETASGEEAIWTTFGADQIDLNYHNPQVLLEILEVLLYYAIQGASFIRLDAVAYLWKQVGTSCVHLPQTHWIVRLIRAVLDEVAPHVMLLTETNVPQPQNFSYFGDGMPEAQLVYNFALPPLLLHAFHTGRAETLSSWASGLNLPSDQVTYFNLLASHDGIGLEPARGILSEAQIEALVRRIEAGGGLVSRKSNSDGTSTPYEINANYFDALAAVGKREELGLVVERFVTAHAIMLSLRGMPGIYFHSLFGSRGWPAGVAQTGRNRSINRQRLERHRFEAELADGSSLRNLIYGRLKQLLTARASVPAFSPHSEQRIVGSHGSVFALVRGDADGGQTVLCVYNLSAEVQSFQAYRSGEWPGSPVPRRDVITGDSVDCGENRPLILQPYQTLWLTA